MQTAFYLKKLKEGLATRQRANPSYSLRAYARDLGLHPATLSMVLNGKRPLPFKNSAQVMERMALNAKERTLFSESLGKQHVLLDGIAAPRADDRFLIDETYFQIIAEWEHYAVLTLFDCDSIEVTSKEIARCLGISKVRAEVVLENLLRYGLLDRSSQGKLRKTHPRVRTTEDVQSAALRASHLDALNLGAKKLAEIETEIRDFSSLNVALDPEKIPEAKAIIREFRMKMLELLKSGDRREVYQLAIQFYPLTVPGSIASRKKSS